jgi:hypothetical protein
MLRATCAAFPGWSKRACSAGKLKCKHQCVARPFSQIKGLEWREREEIEMQSWVHINDEWFSAAPAASVDAGREVLMVVLKRPAAHNYILHHRELLRKSARRALCPSAHHTRSHFCLKQMSLCLTGHVPISFRQSRDNRRSSAQNTYARASASHHAYAGFNFCSLSSPSTSLGSASGYVKLCGLAFNHSQKRLPFFSIWLFAGRRWWLTEVLTKTTAAGKQIV